MDKFDETCECAVVHLTPIDDARFKDSHSCFAGFIRAAINHGTRPISFDVSCQKCHGSGRSLCKQFDQGKSNSVEFDGIRN